MASVSSVNSSTVSSIYGNRNVLSGLASGMDTESMIENAISGLNTKIQNLQRSRTKTEWKMEAMRNISDAMVQFSRKYTSYTSSTNLLSSSFFEKAVITTAQGANAKYVTASGKTNSDIQIRGIQQLASAARYAMKSGGILPEDAGSIVASAGDGKGVVDLADKKPVSNVEGMLTLNFGNKTVSIQFDELELMKSGDGKTAAENMAAAIQEKLKDEKVIMTNGSQKAASDLINVSVNKSTGEISFSDGSNAGNSVYISSATEKIKGTLGIKTGEDSKSITVPTGDDESKLVDNSKTALEYLSGKSMKVSWNGSSKNVAMPTMDEIKAYKEQYPNTTPDGGTERATTDTDAFVGVLQKNLNRAFGSGNVTVSNKETDGTNLKLEFGTGSKGSTLTIESKFGEVLGMSNSETSYLNTGKTMDELGIDFSKLKGARIEANLDDGVEPTAVKDSKGTILYFKDKDGNRVAKDKDEGDSGKWYLADSKDDVLYNLEVNGTNIGKYSKNTALETIMVDINNNAEAGVKVSYSKLTNEMVFTAKETGAGGNIEIKDTLSNGGGNLAAQLFGKIDPSASANYEKGQDAKISVTINGSKMELTRSTNNFDLEGLSVTLKDKFGYDSDGKAIGGTEAITFQTVSDTEKIVETIKSMIDDYNEMVTSIKDAYSTMPAQKANKSRYEPLIDEEMADMSETAIKNYEEKAKQGILFADKDLSSLYGKLRNVFSASGSDGSYLRSIGITTNYSEGLTTIELDENALRDALNSNPDAVADAFTKTKGVGGATTNGIMQGLKTQLDAYASTTGTKGILINKAGSKYSALSLLNNSFQTQLDDVDKQIDKWQDKISDKVDYYTNKFSKLEQLIAQMNSQSSYLQSLQTGG